MSPPVDATEVEKTAEKLKAVRDALKTKGKLEQAEGKARLLRDKSHVEAESYAEMKQGFEKLDFETRKAVESVARSVKFGGNNTSLSFAGKDGGDSEDEERQNSGRDAENRSGRKFTALRPSKNRQDSEERGEENRRRDGKSRGRK